MFTILKCSPLWKMLVSQSVAKGCASVICLCVSACVRAGWVRGWMYLCEPQIATQQECEAASQPASQSVALTRRLSRDTISIVVPPSSVCAHFFFVILCLLFAFSVVSMEIGNEWDSLNSGVFFPYFFV